MRKLLIALFSPLLFTACTEQTPEASMGSILGGEADGYEQVIAGKMFSFPQDHGAHPTFRQEWWYLTANLKTEEGIDLGLQWTQFRFATSSEIRASDSENGWATNQIYMAHSAITTQKAHLADEKWSRGHPEFATTEDNPLTIKLDNWQWRSENQKLLPARLNVESGKFKYQLMLSGENIMHLQGDKGYSRKSADGSVASYYYSQPFITVSGTVTLENESYNVTGSAWLDREWSSQILNESQQGWDWFSLKLDDGSALMLFQLRGEGSKDHYYNGKRMYPDGRSELIASSHIKVKPLEYQTISGREYPVRWNIRIPEQKIDINTDALNPDAKMPLSIPYWEGPVYFSGSHTGLGYMELTGY